MSLRMDGYHLSLNLRSTLTDAYPSPSTQPTVSPVQCGIKLFLPLNRSPKPISLDVLPMHKPPPSWGFHILAKQLQGGWIIFALLFPPIQRVTNVTVAGKGKSPLGLVQASAILLGPPTDCGLIARRLPGLCLWFLFSLFHLLRRGFRMLPMTSVLAPPAIVHLGFSSCPHKFRQSQGPTAASYLRSTLQTL